jgi:hypothetical protein
MDEQVNSFILIGNATFERRQYLDPGPVSSKVTETMKLASLSLLIPSSWLISASHGDPGNAVG